MVVILSVSVIKFLIEVARCERQNNLKFIKSHFILKGRC